MKQLFFILAFLLFSTASFGQFKTDAPQRLTAKGYNLFDGQTKLNAEALESILDFDSFTKYEKARRLGSIGKTLAIIGVGEGIAGGICMALDMKEEGRITAMSYGLCGLGAVCIIAGLPCALVAQGKIQDIASVYNRKAKLAFLPTRNGMGFVLNF